MTHSSRPSGPKEVDSLALANAQMNLHTAYKNFFEGNAEFPKFKNRKARQSYTTNLVNGNIELKDGHIKLPKLKLVKINQHREIPENYKLNLYHFQNEVRKILCICTNRIRKRYTA